MGVLSEAYDEDLLGATVDVLREWEKTFLPPPAVLLNASRKRTHERITEPLLAQKRLDPEETKAWVAKLLAAAKRMN